jgi:hypothetical protein
VPAKQHPSRSEYVVSLSDDEREALARRIGSRGSIETLKGSSNLTLIKLTEPSEDARQAWEQAHTAVGGAAQVQPVLLDPEGKPQYPTGEVSVRFRTALAEPELREFAERHRLRLLRRNEFAPEQAVFEPVEKDRYLPDLVDELSTASEARLAWANTMASYDKG